MCRIFYFFLAHVQKGLKDIFLAYIVAPIYPRITVFYYFGKRCMLTFCCFSLKDSLGYNCTITTDDDPDDLGVVSHIRSSFGKKYSAEISFAFVGENLHPDISSITISTRNSHFLQIVKLNLRLMVN